jgi:hypothetical protein
MTNPPSRSLRSAGLTRPIWLALLSSVVAQLAAAAPTPEAVQRSAEHAAIVKERKEANARFEAQQRVCQARFVVTSCMNEATAARRAVLTRLHERELEIDDAQRRETAALREAAIAEKASKAASAAPAAEPHASEPRHEGSRKPSTPNPPAMKRPSTGASGAPSASAAAGQRKLTEQRNEAAYAAKAREVEAHREAVLKRNAERAAKGKVAAPLPTPASAP